MKILIKITAFILGFIAISAQAESVLHKFRSGSLPIRTGPALTTQKLQSGVITISGTVLGTMNAHLAMRIDDKNSNNYSSRFNMHRVLPPGPFKFKIPLSGLKTAHKKPLDTSAIRSIILFGTHNQNKIRVDNFAIEEPVQLARGASGYSFGKANSPVFGGFKRITAKNPIVKGGNLREVLRPGTDPLLASGINGIEKITLEAKPGRHRVTLWTEETSAWQELRAFLIRRITINGKIVSHEEYTPVEWIEKRYLAGRDREVGYENDIWDLYNKHRGGRMTFNVDVGADGVIEIKIAGSGATALYVSAALVEPTGVNALKGVNQRRRAWFQDTWRVDDEQGDKWRPDRRIHLDHKKTRRPVSLAATRTSGASFTFSLESTAEAEAPDFSIRWKTPDLEKFIKPMIWAGQRRLERETTGGNLFKPSTVYFRSDIDRFRLYGGIERRYAVWLEPTGDVPYGLQEGTLSITSGKRTEEIPLRLYVPPITLKKPRADAGFYMLHAPHLSWHRSLRDAKMTQNACDMRFLSRLGIRGNAPALHVPVAIGKDLFIEDTQKALQFANQTPWLAYSASFGLYQQLGIEKGSMAMKSAMKLLREKGLPTPIWSMADEPGNATSIARDMPLWVAAARKNVPDVKLAGHLNNPKDTRFVSLFDVAIVNQGFGIDRRHIKALKKQNVRPWLYNTGQPRLTAGLWLWITGADRYLQWHGRLPLGDPFDPTDAREGDVSMFPPMPQICAEQPDIHYFMLGMADGIADQRFLTWLSDQKHSEAIKLATIIRKTFNGKWEKASGLSTQHMNSLRIAIAKLALRLNSDSQQKK